MKRLLVSDLDGTILDERGTLPPEFDDLLSILRSHGVGFVPASSRSPQNVTKLFGGIAEIEWAICSDGATVIRPVSSGFQVHHEQLLSVIAAERSLERILVACERRSLVPILFTGTANDFRVLIGYTPCTQMYAEELRVLLDDGRPISVASRRELDHAAAGASVRAVSVYGELTTLRSATVEILENPPAGTLPYLYAESRLSSGAGWLDVFSAQVGKANAIRRLLQCEQAELFAVLGNGANDVEALKLCSRSVCPADAVEEARTVSRTRAKSTAGGPFIAEICELFESAIAAGGAR